MQNRNQSGIKPQDILLLLKLIVVPGTPQKDLSQAIGISPGEISHGFQRLKNSKLLTDDGNANIESCHEFLVHGLKYMMPPKFGPMTVGLPTSFAHPKFNFVRYDNKKNDFLVWPYAVGTKRGTALIPIYPTLVKACADDPKLYYIAALVEMLRVGRVREQKAAEEELNKYMRGPFETKS